ncbi:UNVERIFIED_CONTAM: Inorganic pyrophosphatase TTM2 [Sesamum radiatum]|uniref:Inorganic pyrophosphatase TTM2 n=1 Tax=Sesamum radiatum TaxID=300843 RepID=A0AAW2JRP7_SESRA
MAKDTSNADLAHRKPGLLKDQVRLIKRKDSDRYEIAPIPDNLSFEKGFFVVVRACQLLAQKNDGLILIGVAGPSGAGKTAFTEKILNFMPSIGVISMDNYNDASRIIDGNFDDPRLTDYDTLLKNIQDLKAGKPVDVPVYDFKSSSRTGYRTLEVPSSRIVVIEGIYALSEKLRPFLDLRVSVTGGVHFDLVKRVLRDIQRAGQEPEEIIHQISETVYPMYKAFIEPDLRTAHIKIINKFNPFTGFQSPTYILKSMRDVTVKQVKSIMSEEHAESTEQTYDIYLLPPGEDPETCQSYLRMRNKDGKYNLMFEALPDDLKTKLSIDEDSVSSPKEALSRASAERAARIKNLRSGMSHSYSTNRDKNLSKNRRFEDRTADSSATLANQGAVTHLSEQISTLNDRMDDFTSRIEELNSKLTSTKSSPSSQNIALQAETYNGSAPTSYFISGLGNGSLTGPMMPNSSSSSQLAKESSLFDELSSIARGQRQVMHQLDNLSNLLREKLGERSERDKRHNTNVTPENDLTRVSIILASLAVGSLGIFWFKGLLSRN